MRTRALSVGIAAGLALFTAACGSGESDGRSAGSDGRARRIEVAMVDIAFKHKTVLAVTQGEEVQFTFTNEGNLRHEAYFGTPEDQADHEKAMAEGGSRSGGHGAHGSDNNRITVEPGKTGDLTYRFEEAGTYEIGCHEPGHYAAGMRITVKVT
jgi:uncharacterized cupredoxin-like copper-binding protein